MSDLTSRYSGFLRDIAAIYAHDEAVKSQLKAATVLREDLDDSRGGGHLYFDTPSSVDAVDYDTLDACAEDADGANIAVILHVVGGRLNWGEWFRWDGEPIQRWPPPALRAQG